MKNLSKENVDKLPSKSIDLKSKLNQAQADKNIRKSEGFTTFNLSSKNNTHDDKGFKKIAKNSNEQQVLNNSTIKYISNSDPIEVIPSEIIFKDIQTNQTYEITVYIRNLTKTSRRIRVYQPQTAKFRADYDMQGAIAAGIAMKLVITFETSVIDKNGFHDLLKIVSDENYERDIPLHAYPQQASILFEPFLNLGFVKMNSEKTEKIFFLNEGKIPAKVTLKTAENQDLVIDPVTFTMDPNQEFSVKVTYSPKDAGIFRGLIDVETDAQSLIKQIDVNATSVEFAKFIIDEHGSKIDQQDFGTFYYGEVKKLNCYLVNNTPKKYKFTSRFRDGLIYGSGDMASLQTPIEVGKEQTVKVMSCEPSEGIIDCYSQIQLTFRCQAQVNYKHQISVQNYAISKEENTHENHSDYSYSAIFEFNGEKEDSVIIHITGHGVCPNVKLTPQNILEFGDCSVNDYKDIMFQIANRNMQIPIDVFIPRIPYFHVTPSQTLIGAGETGHFVATFEPKQMQSQSGILNIELVSNQYHIPLKFLGKCRDVAEKKQVRRGPEILPQDFEKDKNFVTEENRFKKRIKSYDESTIDKIPKWLSETDPKFQRSFEKKQEANEYLKSQRLNRVKGYKDDIIKKKFEQMSGRLKSMGMPTLQEENKDNSDTEVGAKQSAPRDFEFEVGMQNRRLDSPRLQIPDVKDSLYVVKHIGKYEPLKGEDEVPVFFINFIIQILKFDPNPDVFNKKKFSSEPKNHAEVRDVETILTGEQLQQIYAGPTYIDFGSVYVKSSQKKYFTIRNDLRTAICVQLFTDCDELNQSYLKPQIIPSSETTGFDVVVQSNNIKNIKQTIKYVINKKHSFEFQILAKIELVKLDLQKTNVKMTFPEDNIDLFYSEVFRVTNNGSKYLFYLKLQDGPAKFKFQHTNNKIFLISPEEGFVPAYGFLDLNVTYSPQPANGIVTIAGPNQQQQKEQQVLGVSRPAEEEKIIMRVADGNETVIKCSGQVPEPKVIPKITQGNNLNLKEIAVCKQELREFQIRNNSRFPAIFQIDQAKLPECTEVTPFKGKLGPDEYRSITVKFYCKEEKTIEGDIRVLIRGGKTISIPFYAKTVIPQIIISEDQFDFGNITTLSNSSALKMTLTNNSTIPVEMVLDLRGEDENAQAPVGIDCLDIVLDQDNEESILHSVHPENDEEDNKEAPTKPQNEEDLGNDALNESELSEEENLEQKKPKLYNFTMTPNQVLVFTVKFSPKETRHYKFLMPITLARYGYLNSMQKYIICKGLNPKFLIEPQICEFKRKIITTPDKCIATNQDIMLSNPDRKPMKWWIDVQQLNIDKIFQINPSEGVVQPGSTAIIKASFNPFSPQKFEKSVSLYVDDPEISSNSPYMDIVLKGEGLFPRLLFDRKEIILPVVPLNVQASCMFRIVNDGYENLNLKYKIIQDISNINVDLNFLEGKNLGITKNRLKIQAVFKSNKPLSFTTRIEFYDDTGRIYTIPISGTSDNCLFTNFAFLQRCSSEFKLIVDQDKKGPVILQMDDAEDDINSVDGGAEEKDKTVKKKGAPSVVSNKTLSSQASSKNSRSALGYSPIPSKDLEESCEFIKRWLNYNVLTQTVLNFPGSVIENNGIEICELITYLTGKQHLPYKVNMEGITKRVDRCQKLFKQYDDMIKQLKTEGALLNHIRPEYLLGFNDYTAYIKLLPKNITDYMTLSSQKLSLSRFNYISIDAWITVFYQILKIYYLSRINSKNFRSIQGIPPEKTTLPSYIDGSNVYSQAECILLYWLEVQYENQHKLQQKRLINFDSDFQNGQIICSTVQSYVGYLRDLEDMKVQVVSESDYETNGEKLISALRRIGLQTHLKKEDIFNANQRQNLLFCLQLLHALPHYIPKPQPIIFSCILGEEVIKNIELTNSTPTGKPISYNVNIEGAPEFSLESDECFSIEPKETYKVKVKFTSRVSDQVTGKITFTNKKESNVTAAALVFELQSNITGRVSIRQWPMQATLYEKQFRDIMVHNPFTNVDIADFQVTLVCEKFKLFQDDKNKQLQRKKKKGVQEKPEEVFPAFYCLKESFKIRKNQTQPLNIIFLPLVLEDQRCFVIFKDKNVGEFQHEIVGRVDEPQSVIDTFKFPQGTSVIYVDDPVNVEFPINIQNDQVNKARNDIISFISEKHREKIKTQKNMQSSQFQQDKLAFPGQNLDQIIFDVELQPPSSYVTVPLTFSLNNPRSKTKKSDRDEKQKKGDKPESVDKEQSYIQENQTNKFPINLSFKNPFNGKLTLCLRNQQKTDIRKYSINIIAHPKPVKATLEFRVPAKNITTQDIPIINNTDKDWAIKVSLTGEHKKNYFMFYSDPKQNKEFTVKKKSTDYFHLHFAPKMQCVCEARLELFNPITNDKFEYELKGFGEEPVAEDHIVINCKARDSTQYDIEIKNPYNDKEVVYQVETDLINSSGPSTFSIKAGKTAKYPLRVSPVLSGQYTGSITFSESPDIYIWYTVLLNTESPRPTDCIELNSQIRQAVSFQIELQNPLKEIAMFDVIINGEGLIGESQFAVQAESTNVYELIFSPLFTGRQSGSIAFINENLGEIWYELKLISEDQPPVRLPVLKTELGKVDSHTIVLENPTDKEVKVQTKIINQTNFDVIPEKIVLKPYDSTSVQIRYMPSNLEMTENGEVTFVTQELGKWKYLTFGIGVPPTKFNERIVSAELNKDFSSTIHFKNPFKENINVTVTMEADEQNQEVFKLLTKSKKNETKTVLNVPGMNIAQIPFSFVPREINCYNCEIVVQMNEKIEWRYPIKGVTESIQNQTSYHFKTQCRNKLEQNIKILLPGLVQINDNKDEFSYDLEIPQEFENLVKGCFRVKALKKTIDDPTEPVEFQIQFEPLKPFKTSFDFNVLRQAGGRWKFRMILEATAPKEDDLIVISSPLNRTTSVSFKLTNHRKKTAFFTASFTPDSDPEFTIMPKQGDMERHGTEGTTFIISFTPIEYGKILKGKLIIQTDELYWSYLVKGVLPKYNPPQCLESGIDDKHNEQISQIMNTKPIAKNYMIDNIKKSKLSPKGKIKVSESLQFQQDSKIFTNIDKSQSFISKK